LQNPILKRKETLKKIRKTKKIMPEVEEEGSDTNMESTDEEEIDGVILKK
jgi:hypothetical protein